MTHLLRQLLRRTTSPDPVIGIDLGRDAVRMLQIETSDDGVAHLVAAARRDLRVHRRGASQADPLAQLEAGMEAVADLLRRGSFKGRRVVAAIPRVAPQFRTLRLNVSEPGELPRMLAREARTALGIDVTNGQYIVHFLPGDTLRRGAETHQEGQLVVVRKRDVELFTARLHDCGAEVAALDLEPLSLYRSVHRFSRRRRDAQDVQVLVDVGTRSTQVVIGRAGRIGFHKSISIGTETMHAAIARKLDLDAAEAAALCRKLEQQVHEAARRGTIHDLDGDPLHRAAFTAARATVEDLARELSLCLRYYCVTFRCKRPDRVLLCGTAAEDSRLWRDLGAALPVPVQPRRPMRDVRVPNHLADLVNERPEEWTTALGLALRFSPAGLAGQAGLSRDAQAQADSRAEADAEFEGPLRRATEAQAAAIQSAGRNTAEAEELSHA